ncbi:Ig-like domain-containing protein [Paludicola sp. MB14-C6]|uniref:Ig-like domain-containing protein n=1 Tax=Paludihabitans sp. MB14-C6 TaxID=3070656 RepID=UPI0027DD5079|nr:Ig-like domain-containing protein [Paludicola sp. MB14-C6]WMJ22069.1 Ig-like domain-containing protein [Paludicola sp. MB14-C6]
MKKKILATLLAVCLCVGIAIPAVFAAATNPLAISTLKVDKASYAIGVSAATAGEDVTIVAKATGADGKDLKLEGVEFKVTSDNQLVVPDAATLTCLSGDDAGKIVIPVGTKLGKANVTIAANGLKATTAIEIAADVYPTSVTVKESKTVVATTYAEKEAKFEYVVSPSNTNIPVVATWDASVAGMATNGTFTATDATAAGAYNAKVKLTFTGKDGKPAELAAVGVLNVVKAENVKTISLPASMDVVAGQKAKAPTVTYNPANANAGKVITWVIENETEKTKEVATIDTKTGEITGVGAGSVIVVATTAGNVSDKIQVNVVGAIKATKVTLDKAAADLEVAKTLTLKATIDPSNSNDKVEWSTSDAAIATVKDGVVTGVKAGTATITVKVGEQTAKCVVTVKAAAPVAPSKPSKNPQTGDSLFANLF